MLGKRSGGEHEDRKDKYGREEAQTKITTDRNRKLEKQIRKNNPYEKRERACKAE